MLTPWGKSQHVDKYEIHGKTIYFVSTASHGGYLVPRSLAEKMPEKYRKVGTAFNQFLAFEEDCACSAVDLAFPEICNQIAERNQGAVTAEFLIEAATETFKYWFETPREERKPITAPVW